MSTDLELAGKWRITAHDRTVVLRKKAMEKRSHVVMKGLLWALYLPYYPELKIEVPIGHRYKPDLVSLDLQGKPEFWGEAGAVGKRKVEHLCKSFRETRLAFAKWGAESKHTVQLFQGCVEGVKREAPVELLFFPEDSRERFVDENGRVDIALDSLVVHRWC